MKIDIPAGARGVDQRETKLGNPALEAEVEEIGRSRPGAGTRPGRRPSTRRSAGWSGACPVSVSSASGWKSSPARPTDGRLGDAAEALQPGMGRARPGRYVVAICGQEVGTKKEILVNGGEVSGRPNADDRQCPGRLSGRPGQRTPSSSPSTPARRKPVGGDFTTRGSIASLPGFAGNISARTARRVRQLLARSTVVAAALVKGGELRRARIETQGVKETN